MTSEEIAVLRSRLTEAEEAYHNLMSGFAVVETTDQNGEKVRFVSARRSDLYAYIQSLKALLAAEGVITVPPANVYKPMGFLF